MSKSKKSTKKAAPVKKTKPLSGTQAAALVEEMKAKKNGKAKTPKQAKPKRTSALDAAAQVLQAAGAPMRCKEMIEAMTAQGLWTSPGGKTPEATLYSAILREVSTKGSQARFKKTERGQFAFNR